MNKVSIICSHFDDEDGLKPHSRFLEEQSFKDWTLILIDAGTQFTKSFLARIDGLLQSGRCKMIVIPSIGVYSGMNLGILSADTPYVQILNSGSKFFNNHSLAIAMSKIVAGDYNTLVSGGALIDVDKISEVAARKTYFPFRTFHEAVIFRNGYVIHDPRFSVTADVKFLSDLKAQGKVGFSDCLLIAYKKGGLSDQIFVNLHLVMAIWNVLFLNSRRIGTLGFWWWLRVCFRMTYKMVFKRNRSKGVGFNF